MVRETAAKAIAAAKQRAIRLAEACLEATGYRAGDEAKQDDGTETRTQVRRGIAARNLPKEAGPDGNISVAGRGPRRGTAEQRYRPVPFGDTRR